MKVLITGAKGQLGSELEVALKVKQCELGDLPKVYKNCDCLALNSKELDITDFEKAREIIEINAPDVLINCAAFTDVDACESDTQRAMAVNAVGAKNLAVICEKVGCKFLHVSTDYVFNGTESCPHCEWDVCSPVTAYGKSKLLGENYVREFCRKYFIVRTSWLYGSYGKNFVKTIINLARSKEKISVVNDQLGNPTNANDLAYHILNLVTTDEYGLYHCAGEGICSWFEFASKIVEYSRIPCEVVAISTEDYKHINHRAAARPKNSALENLMLKVKNKNKMRSWQIALQRFLENHKEVKS